MVGVDSSTERFIAGILRRSDEGDPSRQAAVVTEHKSKLQPKYGLEFEYYPGSTNEERVS
jgi:hypothetical protein